MNENQTADLMDLTGAHGLQDVSTQALSIYEKISEIFDHSIFAGFTPASVLYQLGAIAAAVIVAFIVAKVLGARILALRVSMTADTWGQRFARMGLSLVRALLFSVTAAFLLSLCVMVMSKFGLVSEQSNLIFIRLAYQIFYAWAILYVLMQVLGTLLGDKFFGATARKFVATSFWGLAALQIVGILPEIVELMKEYSLPIGSDKVTIWTLFVGLVTVLLTLSIANKLAGIFERQIMGMHEMEMNLRVVFARITRVSLMILGVLIALSTVGINLTVLSVFGGALGVGIGFGMQKIASNYISGFIILFDRSVKLGDMVEVGAFSGVVTQINTRYSVLRNMAGEELIVPNENFVTGTVKNYSFTDKEFVVTVEVSCAYEADVDRALAVFMECVKAQPRVLQTKEPWVVVSGFGASGINLKAGFWVTDPQKGVGGLKSNIMRDVLKRFNAENIEIPYDKLDLTVKNVVEVQQDKQAA